MNAFIRWKATTATWHAIPTSPSSSSSSTTATISITKTTTTTTTTTRTLLRCYVSRAHPKPKPVYGIQAALERVLEDVQQRKIKRAVNWERFKGQRERRGVKIDPGPYRNLNETVEFAVNLNVDTRKPGQMLRGSVALPHGTGKQLDCIVFTMDPDVEREALAAGAKYAGGLELMDQIVRGTIPLDTIQRALGAPNMVGYLSKSPAARMLGPRGLMPNVKMGTAISDPQLLLQQLRTEMAGQKVQYRTDKEGVVHLGIGKGSFTVPQLIENVRAIAQEITKVKPETYGKTKKKKKKKKKKGSKDNKGGGGGGGSSKGGSGAGKKYLMRCHVTSTFGNSFRVDIRTVDPTSMYFMTALPSDRRYKEKEEEEKRKKKAEEEERRKQQQQLAEIEPLDSPIEATDGEEHEHNNVTVDVQEEQLTVTAAMNNDDNMDDSSSTSSDNSDESNHDTNYNSSENKTDESITSGSSDSNK